MPNNRAAISGRYSNNQILTTVDFTSQTVGGLTSMPSNLQCARSSTTDTVQTSDQTVSASLAANVARIGQRTSSSATRGLVIEESRVNRCCASEEISAWSSASLQATRTDNVAASPNGATTADQIQWTGTAGYNGCYASESLAGTAAATYQMTYWVKHVTMGDSMQSQSPTNASGTVNTTPSLVWTRYTGSGTAGAGGEQFLAVKANGALLPNVYLWGAQSEEGSFATEYTPNPNKNPSAANVTRAGERIFTAVPASWMEGSRVSLYVKAIPKGSSTQYANNMRLWTVDGSNYCEINKTTRLITMVVGGNSFVSSEAVSWSALDTVEFWTEGGGTAIQSVMAYRVNGGTTIRLGTSNGAMGAITATTVDFCCNGTSNQLTSWIQTLTAYRAGGRPSWVG